VSRNGTSTNPIHRAFNGICGFLIKHATRSLGGSRQGRHVTRMPREAQGKEARALWLAMALKAWGREPQEATRALPSPQVYIGSFMERPLRSSLDSSIDTLIWLLLAVHLSRAPTLRHRIEQSEDPLVVHPDQTAPNKVRQHNIPHIPHIHSLAS
jgi:hypothetical protein